MSAPAAANPTVQFETSEGPFTVELWPDVAPLHTANFLKLASTGFYNNLTFHRILEQFVIQGGCPKGNGTGNPGWTVKAEFNNRKHEKGVLSMARSQHPDSAGSQFFVCLSRERCVHLDNNYTAFGKVTAGLDTIDKIAATPLANRDSGTPVTPPRIKTASVVQ